MTAAIQSSKTPFARSNREALYNLGQTVSSVCNLPICSSHTILHAMIQSFRHKGLKRLFEKAESKGIRPEHVEKVENILFVLNRARKPQDMDLPGFRLHPLKGKLKGFYAVTVRANWRVVFRYEGEHAYDVNLVDYH